jgi:hypothetical protein
MSAALIKMASALLAAPRALVLGLRVAGYHEQQLDHKAGRFPQYRRNNIKI